MREPVKLFKSQDEVRQEEKRILKAIYILASVVASIIIFVMIASASPVQLKASWYSRASLIQEGTWRNGKESRMANGQRFDENALTCAARLWPLGTRLLVRNTLNGKTVKVVCTDRIGKRFAQTRIDLARGAFERIANLKQGVVPVTVEAIE